MKKLLCLLLCSVSVTAFGQDKTLYKFNVLKTRSGMRSSFEDHWKVHMEKFHKITDKRIVYEVTSGSNIGTYKIVEGPISYSDINIVLPNKKEHELDLEKTFSRQLGPGSSTLYNWIDTLSHQGNTKTEEFLVTSTVLKDGKAEEYLAELRRAVIINNKLNIPYSTNVYVKQQAGSSPNIVTMRNLVDGFKELDSDFLPVNSNQVRDEYIKVFGHEAWDKRTKLLVEDIVSREQHFEKFRPDLSSK